MTSNPDNKPDIPAIVTTDLSSTPNLHVSPPDDDHDAQTHDAAPSSPPASPPSAFLSPLNVRGRSSTDAQAPVPGSPVPSFTSSVETHVPPSPTLSTTSVHFAAPNTSLALRDNRPDENNGMSSLNLLSPHYGQHRRKGSVASSMDGSTEGTEPDSHSISLQPLTPQHTGGDGSTIVSPTNTHYDGASDIERSKGDDAHAAKTGEGDEQQEDARPILDLSKDADIDAGPFPFKPYRLASLVDPKNMDELKEMGGVTGLLKGLGTHRKRGLGRKALGKAVDASHHASRVDQDGRPGAGDDPGAGVGASQRHDRQPETAAGDVPKLVLTGPGGDDDGGVSIGGSAVDEEPEDGTGPTYDADLEERRRVYGANVIPTRQSKSLLQLMWLALKDKVLVSTAFLTAIISSHAIRIRFCCLLPLSSHSRSAFSKTSVLRVSPVSRL